MKEFVLIEAPSNLGLKEPQPGVEPGVKFFPSVMEQEGFASLAGIKKKTRVNAHSLLRSADFACKHNLIYNRKIS